MSRVRIKMTGFNQGQVWIDDQEIKGIQALEFQADASGDAVPTLVVTFPVLDLDLETEDVVDVTAIGDTSHRFAKKA